MERKGRHEAVREIGTARLVCWGGSPAPTHNEKALWVGAGLMSQHTNPAIPLTHNEEARMGVV
jgi:hypothetical protein